MMDRLTSCESQVCRELVKTSLVQKEIAAKLGKSHRTVTMQVTSIYKKLGVNSRLELIQKLSSTNTCMKYLMLALLFAGCCLAQQHSVTLSWTCTGNCATADNPTGFIALRGTTSGGPYNLTACQTTSVTTTSCVDIQPLVEGATYYYVVETTAAGGVTSVASNEVSAVIPFSRPQAPIQNAPAVK